ncbi:MAG: hypothetical protein LLG13_18675 [Bacteroidales bacterium]|nr:hypothetical protein [Bacteroidales bacterium]
MGAFFLYHKDSKITESLVDDLYALKGFKNPFKISIGSYNLVLFRKQAVNIMNYYKNGENYLFVVGSLFYKGSGYKESLEKLLNDFTKNCIEPQNLYGNYVMIFYANINKQITFCIDPAFIKNVYFDAGKKIITTDFLALIEAFPGFYSLNKTALIENLTTGSLISPDTYAKEIQKLDKVNITTIELNFPGIRVQQIKPEINESVYSYKTAVEQANKRLSEYFSAVRNLTDEFGAHIGLTGGFDSRLLLIHAKKRLKHLSVNSFWRDNSLEYLNAKELAKVSNLDFFTFEDAPYMMPGKEVMLVKSYYFFDGQIRSQNNWEEEFSLSDYTFRIASNNFVGFHGCGGEQYRNANRLMRKMSLRTFIMNEWMFKQCLNVFSDINLQKEVYQNIENKILRLVNIENSKVGLYELKRIQNEVWNSANRVTRVNLINQQMFYFAPFTEYTVSMSAYDFVPYLGNSFSFQKEMMKEQDKSLAGVKTNYGFNILEKEPLKYKIIPYIVNVIPRSLFYPIFFKRKNQQRNSFSVSEFEKNAHPVFLDLVQGINLDKLGKNINLGNSINSFNYFIKKTNLR